MFNNLSLKTFSFIFSISLFFFLSTSASFSQVTNQPKVESKDESTTQKPKTPLATILDDQPSSFKAKQIYKQTTGYVNTITYSQKGNLQRIDTEQNGVEMSVISRPDKEKKFLVVPSQSAYSELQGNSALFLRTDPFYLNQARSLPSRNVKIEDLGSEAVSGHPCKKFRISFDEAGNVKSVTIWKATDLSGLIIRQDLDFLAFKDSFELSDISLDVPNSLFELPSNLSFFPSSQDIFLKKKPSETPAIPVPK